MWEKLPLKFAKILTKKLYFWHILGLYKLQIIRTATYIALFLPGVVKLRFLLIYKYMLKNIPTTRSEWKRKHEKGRAKTHCFWFHWPFWRWTETRSQHRLKKEIFIFVKNIDWLKIGLLLVFSMNFLSTIWKNDVLAICIHVFIINNSNSLLSDLFSHKILKNSLNRLIFCSKPLPSLFWGGMFPPKQLKLFPFVKIKNLLMLTNFTLVM